MARAGGAAVPGIGMGLLQVIMSKVESVPLLQRALVKWLLLTRAARSVARSVFCRSRMHTRVLLICICPGECSTSVGTLTRLCSVCGSPRDHRPHERPESGNGGMIDDEYSTHERGRRTAREVRWQGWVLPAACPQAYAGTRRRQPEQVSTPLSLAVRVPHCAIQTRFRAEMDAASARLLSRTVCEASGRGLAWERAPLRGGGLLLRSCSKLVIQ